MWMIAFGFMAVCSVIDIRKKEIPLLIIGLFGAAAAAYAVIFRADGGLMLLCSLIPGAGLLTLGLCTRESIGYGDGLMVLALGLLLGFERCLVLVVSAMLASSMAALILLALRKVNGKSRLPFAPFLMIGLGVVFLVWN